MLLGQTETVRHAHFLLGGLSIMKLSNFLTISIVLLLNTNVTALARENSAANMFPLFTEEDILNEMRPQFYEALSGSGSAAMKISQALAEKILPQKNKTHPFEKWQQIAAENGYKNAQHAYAQTLWSKRNTGDKIYYSLRAKYWAKKAADQGFLPGKSLLESFEAEEREEKKSNSLKRAPSSSVRR
jgi:spore germination protein GerM